ncbi:MAG: cytidine deaminase [Anaerolineales bacterium]|nr:cytidine deaminase [Anaerolineales bacterium]
MEITIDQRNELIERAIQIRERAYAPYSGYAVGAALLAKNGKIFTGVNVENAAYPASICAERTAVFKAVSEGEKAFIAIAVATDNAGSPCGSCRQVLSEFGLDMLVYMVDPEGNIREEATVQELLPFAFQPSDLPGGA